MKRLILAATAAIAVLCVPLSAAGDAAAGKALYAKKCAMCHAADGSGAPAMKKKFGDKLKPLASAEVQKMKDADLMKAFKEAANHKAIAKGIADADLENIVAHIRTLK